MEKSPPIVFLEMSGSSNHRSTCSPQQHVGHCRSAYLYLYIYEHVFQDTLDGVAQLLGGRGGDEGMAKKEKERNTEVEEEKCG